MISYMHLTMRFAAAAGIAIALTAMPAMAEGSTLPVVEASTTTTTVKGAPAIVHHRSARTVRRVASRHRNPSDVRVSAIRSDLGCSGTWCGRQFVLMIGIGF
jgi:hypothetical protein